MTRYRKPEPQESRGGGAMFAIVGIVVVAAAIAIGFLIGDKMLGGEAPVVNSPAAPGLATPVPGMPTAVSLAATGQPPIGVSSAPVDVAVQPAGAGEPRLWIPEAAEQNFTYHLGDIPYDAKSEKEFTLENTGSGTLVIEDVSASCGCTAATVGEKELAPGATTLLRVSYDPRVNGETGKFVQKDVTIKSNDPLVPLAKFTITADVASE